MLDKFLYHFEQIVFKFKFGQIICIHKYFEDDITLNFKPLGGNQNMFQFFIINTLQGK